MMEFLKGLFGMSKSQDREEPAAKAPRALSTEAVPAPAAPGPGPTKPAPPAPAPIPDGPPDFQAVLEKAGVTAEQRLRVQKAQDLLKSLPKGATPTLKREIVEAAFRAFDIPTQEIIRAASSQIAALRSFVAEADRVKQLAVEQAEGRVKELEKQIAEVRALTDKTVAAHEAREVATRKEIGRVEPVLEFFVRAEPTSAPAAAETPTPAPAAGAAKATPAPAPDPASKVPAASKATPAPAPSGANPPSAAPAVDSHDAPTSRIDKTANG